MSTLFFSLSDLLLCFHDQGKVLMFLIRRMYRLVTVMLMPNFNTYYTLTKREINNIKTRTCKSLLEKLVLIISVTKISILIGAFAASSVFVWKVTFARVTCSSPLRDR